MHKLTHYPLCPFSRAIRIVLSEMGVEVELIEERPWEWRPAFLAINPAGELPVLEIDNGPVLMGSYSISEYLADLTRDYAKDGFTAPLFPGSIDDRAEVRRLVDWFHGKLYREVTRELLEERVFGHQKGAGHSPDPAMLRAVRANLRHHLSYVNYLADARSWLAGPDLTYADAAAAAHISIADYLNETPWADYPAAKAWYARMKSRPSMRPLLADRIPGIAPAGLYANLDF